jgi:biotin operon repressor
MKHKFTPYSEELAHELDPLTSLVYGKVWRFAQMDEGVCRASAERIAEELGFERKAVGKKLKKLTDNGYLIETTKPGLKNRPHIYKPTDKINFQWHEKKQKTMGKGPATSLEFRE